MQAEGSTSRHSSSVPTNPGLCAASNQHDIDARRASIIEMATEDSGATLRILPHDTQADVASQMRPQVFGICLVAFDHAQGPIVEYAFPPSLRQDDELNKSLPFLALPDGAHAREEDYSYFHMFLPSVAPTTVFGISCNRQIMAEALLNKGKDVTRSTVQKAVVVLASKPIFGPLREKLGVVTRTFFAQRDFEDKSILDDLYKSLENFEPVQEQSGEEAGGLYMGTSLRELVHTFRFKTLMLLKLLMLQRRVMFYAPHTPVERLCTFQYSLVALIPTLLLNLEDAALPELNTRLQLSQRTSSLRTTDKQSLIRYLGLPLNVFGKSAFFQPYLPLQQIDLLKSSSFLVGTTNSIFQQQKDCQIDVIVNLDNATLDIVNQKLSPLLTLTAADRKWMDEIVSIVDSTWNAEDPSRSTSMRFVGSDDYVRAKFEEYICSLLSCIKFEKYLSQADTQQVEVLMAAGQGPKAHGGLSPSFNEAFVRAFSRTPAFTLWDSTTDETIFDLVEPTHPMEGKTNALEDVGIRLVSGLHDLHIAENLGPTKDAIQKGIATGSESLWKTYTSIRKDLARRSVDGRERDDAGDKEGSSQVPNAIAHTFLTGVDVARSGAGQLATGLGSFWASKKPALFGSAAATGTGSYASDASTSSPTTSALGDEGWTNGITSANRQRSASPSFFGGMFKRVLGNEPGFEPKNLDKEMIPVDLDSKRS